TRTRRVEAGYCQVAAPDCSETIGRTAHAKPRARSCQPPLVDRRLPRVRDVPDGGRALASQPGGQIFSRQRGLAMAGPSHPARRLDRLLAPRPHSALVYLPGRRRAPVFDCQPPSKRTVALTNVPACDLARSSARGAGGLSAIARATSNTVDVRRHAQSDRVGLCVPVFAWFLQTLVSGAGAGCDPRRLLGCIRVLSRARS